MKKENQNPNSGRKEFGNYYIGKTLGEGTFGKVKLGTHKITGENVAIKILEKDKINDLADTERVLREIHILKLIRHPNIVQLYEIIQTPKRLFLVIEFMEGGELFDYIVKNQRIREDQACRLFHQLIDGVQHIHKIGVVHRDLKPENLLLDYKKNLRIVDFGLSNTYKKNDMLKTPCGSPCYAAPEMLKGEAYGPLKVDIWSSGVILFTMLCGYLPFEDNQNTHELYAKILAGDFKIHPSVSESARDLLQKIMTVDPRNRYTIEEIRKHPWMMMNSCRKNNTQGIVIGYNKIPIDENVLFSLKDFNYDIDYASKCLEANRHNNITTTYYLALKKFIKEGGRTLCDLADKNFDKSLLQPNRRRNSQNEKPFLLSDNFFYKTEEEPRKLKIANAEKSIGKSIQKKNQSKGRKIDPRIENSINYGRIAPSTTTNKSKEKIQGIQGKRRQSQIENRLSRKYKQKFNQSLVSKSRDKICHNKSRINSSINRTKRIDQHETHEASNLIDEIQLRHKRAGSKKVYQNGKNSTKVIRARKL